MLEMKYIISQGGIKREIEGPFAMCCDPADLEILIQELQRARMTIGSYGWFRIDPSHPSDCPPNTRPLKWTEVGNINPPSSTRNA